MLFIPSCRVSLSVMLEGDTNSYCSLGNTCKNLIENKLKAKVFENLEEFPKIHQHFGTSFLSSTHAIDNRNLCKQGKDTLPIISISSDRGLSRKCTENWQAEMPSSCAMRVLPDTNTSRTSWLQRLKCPRDRRTLNNLGFGKFTS